MLYFFENVETFLVGGGLSREGSGRPNINGAVDCCFSSATNSFFGGTLCTIVAIS